MLRFLKAEELKMHKGEAVGSVVTTMIAVRGQLMN